MSKVRQALRILRALWRSGLIRLSLNELMSIVGAWRRCRSSFAFLSATASIRFGRRVALQDENGPMTFSELHLQSLALANALILEHGLGPDGQVALVCRNSRGFVLGLLACTRVGADVLPLGPDLPVKVMEAIFERQNIGWVLHDTELNETVTSAAPLKWRTCAVGTPLRGDAVEPAPVTRGGELIVLTSGTTGVSKGIRRRPTIGQLLPLLAGLLESIPVQMHRPIVPAIPLYHGYGVATLAMALALGSPLQLAPRYDIGPLLARLSSSERPFLVTVPTLLSRWRQEPKDFSAPQPAAIITGSAPLPPNLCTQLLEDLGPVLFNLYGSSEAGLIALALPETLRRAPGCVGQPLPGNQVRLLDNGEEEVAFGATGRIFVRGSFVLPDGADGWRETGDLGRWDDLGNLYVCGRSDAMLVSGGENVFPHEVEEVLRDHPEVVDVAVLVVHDAEFGQRMETAVVLRSESSWDEARLRDWMKQRLERHKVPRRFHIVGEIPKNPLGKLDKRALTSLLAEDS